MAVQLPKLLVPSVSALRKYNGSYAVTGMEYWDSVVSFSWERTK